MSDRFIEEQYEGLDGGAMGCEEIATIWIETWERADGSQYTKRVLRHAFYTPHYKYNDSRTVMRRGKPMSQPSLIKKQWVPLLVLRRLLSFILAFPLGIVWFIVFVPLSILSAAWRLDMGKTVDDMDYYFEILTRILKAIRGNNN